MDRNKYKFRVWILVILGAALIIFIGSTTDGDYTPIQYGVVFGSGYTFLVLGLIEAIVYKIKEQEKMIEDLQEHLERLGLSDKE